MKAMTKHAQSRMQQRAVPPLVIQWLLDFGATEHDHHGAEIRYFNKTSRKQLASAVGAAVINRLTDLLDAYLVVKDCVVITVGYRFKHINRI